MIHSLNKEGNFKVCVNNKSGELIHREIKNNTVTTAFKQDLVDALCAPATDWDGSSNIVNVMALDSYVSAVFGVADNVPDVGGTDVTVAQGQGKTAISISQNTNSGYAAILKGTSAASASSGTITFSSFITGIGGSWQGAKFGVLSSFDASGVSGDGAYAFLRQYCSATYSSITLTTDDTLTITWTVSLTGS